MDFLSFALHHGLEIKTFRDDGVWHRCPTTDKPKSYNGAYRFCGDHGFVQNHATMDRVELWKSDKPVDLKYYAAKAKSARESIVKDAEGAAKKAGWMMANAVPAKHDYLFLKGFPNAVGMTLEMDDRSALIIPMRIDNRISSLQIISFDGEKWNKRFIKGGITKNATFTIGKGRPVLCEGYATGLSVHEALKKASISARVVVCFSANNMISVAQQERPMLVIADNDESLTGLKAAEKIGAKYWMSKIVGNDFNDDHQQRGIFTVSQELKRMI